jgi:3-hydroxyacyl-CoA dehydrogenase
MVQKGDSHLLCEAPFGPFRQKVAVTFLSPWTIVARNGPQTSFHPSLKTVRGDGNVNSQHPPARVDASDDSAREHLRGLIERNNRQIDREYVASTEFEIGRVGVVGAGAMGTKIAATVVRHGLPVTLVDRDETALLRASEYLLSVLREDAAAAETPDRPVDAMLRCARDLSDMGPCDLVIESVPEKPEVKKSILRDLEGAVSPTAVLATNTSTIAIARLAEALAGPDRLCGLHFFMPDSPQPILEVTPGPATSRATVARGVAFSRRVGHMPLVVSDGVGFLANRLVMSYMSAGLGLLQAGVDLLSIERAADGFGMSMGPFRLYDEIGVDVALHCGWCLALTSDELMARSPLHISMVKAGYLGRKTGHGFFTYDASKDKDAPASIHPGTQALIDRWVPPESVVGEEFVIDGLVLPMVLEATRLLAEGRARNPGQIDLAAVFGFGFPSSRGGPLYWADGLGAARVVELLRPLESLGPRYQLTPMLLEMASRHERFHVRV